MIIYFMPGLEFSIGVGQRRIKVLFLFLFLSFISELYRVPECIHPTVLPFYSNCQRASYKNLLMTVIP